MSYLTCPCGADIVDRADNLPYKAYYLADTDTDATIGTIPESILAFFKARAAGTDKDWLSTFFSAEYAALPLSDASIVHDIVFKGLLHAARDLYQCVSCGRLLVEARSQPNHFLSFSSDAVPFPDVFTPERPRATAIQRLLNRLRRRDPEAV